MKTKDINNLINKISNVCNFKKTGLHEPVFSHEEIKFVNKSIKSSMVSSTGGLVNEFEKKNKKICKIKTLYSNSKWNFRITHIFIISWCQKRRRSFSSIF